MLRTLVVVLFALIAIPSAYAAGGASAKKAAAKADDTLNDSSVSRKWRAEDVKLVCSNRHKDEPNQFKDCMGRMKSNIGHKMMEAEVQELAVYTKKAAAKAKVKGAAGDNAAQKKAKHAEQTEEQQNEDDASTTIVGGVSAPTSMVGKKPRKRNAAAASNAQTVKSYDAYVPPPDHYSIDQVPPTHAE